MFKKDKNVYEVKIKPQLNFMGKFYIVCIILFVLFVTYIIAYREIHREEIIENLKNNNKQVVVENTTNEIK